MPALNRMHADGRATREHIIEVAIQAFAEHGYRGTSMNRIAAAAGLTRQGLAHHFPAKVDLLLAVIDQRDADDAVQTPRMLARHIPLGDVIQAAIRRHLGEGAVAARLFTILSAESVDADHPTHQLFVDRYKAGREIMTRLVAEDQARGHLTDAIAPESLAITLLALMDGLQLQAQLAQEPLDVARALGDLLTELGP